MFCEVYKSHPWCHGYPPSGIPDRSSRGCCSFAPKTGLVLSCSTGPTCSSRFGIRKAKVFGLNASHTLYEVGQIRDDLVAGVLASHVIGLGRLQCRPLNGTVHHREYVSVARGRQRGAHQVDVDVRKTAPGHIDATDRRAHVSRHHGLLTIKASQSPEPDVFIHSWPQKSWIEQHVLQRGVWQRIDVSKSSGGYLLKDMCCSAPPQPGWTALFYHWSCVVSLCRKSWKACKNCLFEKSRRGSPLTCLHIFSL